jgi:hypothetical protein
MIQHRIEATPPQMAGQGRLVVLTRGHRMPTGSLEPEIETLLSTSATLLVGGPFHRELIVAASSPPL